MDVEIEAVNPNALVDAATSTCPVIKRVATKTHVFDDNSQKQFIFEYDLQKCLKQIEWDKTIANKKTLINLFYRQCDKATLTMLALGATYKADHNNENLMHFLGGLRDICYQNNDGGLSYTPYKTLLQIHHYTISPTSN